MVLKKTVRDKRTVAKKKARKNIKRRSSKEIVIFHKAPHLSSKGYFSIIIFLLLILLDRLTKAWAVTLAKTLDYGVVSFLYVTNTGAGFSTFQDSNNILIWVAIIALGVIIFYREHIPNQAFLLILAGLIGNLIDRISYGHVVDFINLKFWPIFNLADAMITIGAIITVAYWIKSEIVMKKKNKKQV